ncbi:MAG: glycoside hydrolase family 38 C-terminal domain-containing protein, partial [Eubacteriales bacterium]
DKNMPDGESLSRHILMTKRYLHELFGVDPDELKIDFEPDTFGHNANVPEICSAGGVSYYYHCRGYDGHHIYRWRAPSGAELLCYREPVWYNAEVKPESFLHLPSFCAENGIDTALFVYGVGDHGGGPTRRDLSRLLDMREWPLMPALEFGTFRRFFDSLNERRERFPVVEGELNFVFTGCYTTQSRIKAANRIAEARMNEAEALLAMDSVLTGDAHPASKLHDAWEGLLFNHFHDIIPGSGTVDTREYALGQFQRVLASVDTQAAAAMRGIANAIDTAAWASEPDPESRSEGAGVGYGVGTRDSGMFAFPQAGRGNGETRLFTVFNTTPYERDETAELTVWDYPVSPERLTVTDAAGAPLPFETCGETKGYWGHRALKVSVRVKMPPMGYRTVVLRAEKAHSTLPVYPAWPRVDAMSDDGLVLENEHLRAEFERETMALVSLTDLGTGRVLINRPSCVFLDILESDDDMSAWRVGDTERCRNINAESPAHLEERLAHGFRYSLRYRENLLTVRVTLDPGARTLRFELTADWFERGSRAGIPQLRFAVPYAGDPARKIVYDIPYGTIERAPLRHDVPALSFAAVPEGIFAASDTKYGFRGADGVLSVNLLRASYDPDPYPELGRHHCTLFVGAADGDPIRTVSLLTHPLHAVSVPAHAGTLPADGSLLCAEGGARIYAVKPAEEDGIVVRLVGERDGAAVLRFARPVASCTVTDTVERGGEPLAPDGGCVRVPVKAGGITTLRVTF